MLEFFRRHRGAFLIILTVIIIISFSFWGGYTGQEPGQIDRNATAFTIYGKEYPLSEMQRFERYQYVAQQMGMFELAFRLPGLYQQFGRIDGRPMPADFIFNLLVLRKEMENHGIRVSDEEALAEIQKLYPFQKDGKFDPATYQSVQERLLGAFGFRGGDLLEMMKDQIGLQKLQALVAGNVEPSRIAVEKSYAERYQTLKIATVDFSLDAFKKDAKVTEDEIKKYYEENKESYKTATKRAISYVLFEEPKAENEKGEKLDAEKFAEAQKKFGERVRKFNDDVTAPGAKLGEKILTLDLFEQGTPPEAIKDESDLISSVFFNDPKLRPVSDPVRGSKGIYIFTVTKDEQPRQQELKEVEAKVKDALIATKAEENMMKAANEARTDLQEGLKAGKKLADLVKEKKLTLSAETEYSPAATANPQESKLGARVTEAATHLAAGQPSVPISTETGAAIVFVNARELRKRDDSATQRSSIESGQQSQGQSDLFKAWFRARRDAAGVDYKLQLS
jgi:tellurite resistance protein